MPQIQIARFSLVGFSRPFNIIEVMMIQLLIDRRKSLLDITKVDNPTTGIANRPFDMDRHHKRMAVQTRTFMPLRNIGKTMSRLDIKFFVNLHFYYFRGLIRGHILGPHKLYVYSVRKCLTANLNSVECTPSFRGWLAQLVEHRPYKARVTGSIPVPPTKV